MTAENVTVTVGTNDSLVAGNYSFQQQVDDWPDVQDKYVLIYVPVLLTLQSADKYEKRYGLPVVIAKGKRFSASIKDDLAFEDHPQNVPLPKGWFMQIFEAKIPLNLLSKSFQIEVHYVQPNFPGNVAGYVPLNPPKDSMSSEVTFTAIKGRALRPLGFFSGLSSPKNQLTFTPQDRKLISARLVKQ